MARVIHADKCVACGSCIGECPVEAINEGDVYTIDANACIDCGACEATCPNEAIYESDATYYDSSFSNIVNDAANALEQKVREIIVEKLGVEGSEVTMSASFANDLGADDMDVVEVLMEFEKEFGIRIPDDQVENIATVGDAVAYIIGKGVDYRYKQFNQNDANKDSSLTKYEQDYLNQLKVLMDDGANLTPRELKILDRVRESLGISVERAKELKDYLLNPQLTDKEQQYLDSIKEFLDDETELSSRERKMLERIRESLGISEDRAREIEGMISKPQLTEDEQEYVDMYREYAANGEITEKDRRKLDKYASILGISPKRAKELEEL